MTYFGIIAVIAILLLVQLSVAIRRHDAALTTMTIAFGVWFVWGGLCVRQLEDDYRPYFVLDEETLVRSAVLGVVVLAAFTIGYIVPQRARLRLRPSTPAPSWENLLLVSFVGVAATAVLIVKAGGISMVWAREGSLTNRFSFQGTLSILSSLTLVQPLFVYRAGPAVARAQKIQAGAVLGVYAVGMMISGTTTAHLLNATPFALIWLQRHRPSMLRTLGVLLAGAVTVSGLRYLRYVGGLAAEHRDWIRALWEFVEPSNTLNLVHSFGEFFMFAKTLEVTDTYGWQWGRSYAVAASALIPGDLLPGKADFAWINRADRFIPRLMGYPHDLLWPSGFYGEGYQNFGLMGVIVSAFVAGWLLKRGALWISMPGRIFGIPTWLHGCYLVSAVAGCVRQEATLIMIGYSMRIILLGGILIPLGALRPGSTRSRSSATSGAGERSVSRWNPEPERPRLAAARRGS